MNDTVENTPLDSNQANQTALPEKKETQTAITEKPQNDDEDPPESERKDGWAIYGVLI